MITRSPQTRRACECHAPFECRIKLSFFFSISPHLWHVCEARNRATTPTRGLSLLDWLHSLIWLALPGFMTSPQKSRKPKNNEQKDYGYASRVGSGAATKAGVSHLGFRSNGQLRLRHLVHIFYSFLWPAYKSDRQHDWISKGLIYRITLSWRLEFLIYKTHLNSL